MAWLWFFLGAGMGASLVFWWHFQPSFSANPDRTTGSLQETALGQQALHQAPLGYLQVDGENCIFGANPLAGQLLGTALPPGRLLLQLVRSYELDQLIQETRSQRRPMEKSWTFHPAAPDPLNPVQPSDIFVRGYAIPLAYGHVGIFIEDRREAVYLSQQRDRWTSDVAHELKTPLTSMRLLAETLQERLPEDLRSWIERLLQEVLRLSNVVEDLLDLGQQDMGKPPILHLTEIDLPTLLFAVWQSLEPLAVRKKVRLQYEGPDRLVLQGDEPRLHRLFFNLLDNAIKYSPPLQVVLTQVTPSTDQVLIEVIDCGCGFLEESLPFVFDRFYRADPSRSRLEQGGSGLGLAIVRQSVLCHNGTVQAANHPETGGAWIKVTLPLHSCGTVMSGQRG